MRFAIVDDHQSEIDTLEKMIKDYYKLKNPNIYIDCFESAEDYIGSFEACKKLNADMRYDAIFLDIEMPGKSGIELAKKIRDEYDDYTTQIIYITSHSDYMPEAFGTITLDYLEKPISTDKLYGVLAKLEKMIISSELTVSFVEDRINKRVLVRDIMYIVASGRKLHLHTVNQTFSTNSNLEDMLSKLPDKTFVMINRSVIVNIGHIETITSEEVILKCNMSFTVGKKYYKDILALL